MSANQDPEPPSPPRDVAVDIARLQTQAGEGRAELAQLQHDVMLAQLRLGAGQGAQLETANQQLIASMLETRNEAQNAERALTEAAAFGLRLDELFEFSRDAMARLSATGRILRINQRAEEMFGFTRADAIGAPVESLLAPESRAAGQAAMAQLRASPPTGSAAGEWPRLQAMRQDGSVFPVDVGLSLADPGSEEAIVAVFDDTTEREELAEALQQSVARYRATLDHMIEGCQIIDADWLCRYANDTAARHANRSPQSLIGRTLMRAHPGIETTEVFAMSQRCMADRVPQHAEVEAVFPAGLRGRFQVSVCPAPDGISIFSVDVTRQRRAEQEVRAVNADLERRVADRTAELDEARCAAEAANRAKSEFLAAMSHEIRTPMNGVVGMIEVLSRSELCEDDRDAVRTVRRSAFSLLRIIDDILDFSKIEAGRVELEHEEVLLVETIESVCDTLLPMADERHVDLRLFIAPEIPAAIRGDATRLRQVVINLLSNAIKFGAGTPAKRGHVEVRAEMPAGARPALTLQVVDDGIGITPEGLASLFTPFTQAEASTTRRFGGSGLGLTICKRLVTLMGGTIEVRSSPGSGAAFVVTLPVEAVEPAAAQEASVLDGQACVIVGAAEADDDLRTYLERAGAQVTVAADLQAAVDASHALEQAVFVHRVSQAQWAAEPARLRFAGRAVAGHLLIEPNGHGAAHLVASRLVAMGGRLLRRSVLLRAVAIAAGRLPAEPLHDAAAAEPAHPPPRRASVDEARAQGRLLLIAEDDEVNQLVIRRQIEILGCAAVIAFNGKEALEMWRSDDFALLLTDLHMPDMDGYTLAQSIRHAEAGQGGQGRHRMPILALTANALRGEEGRAYAAGIDEYLVKPLQLDMLDAALRKWLPARPDAPGAGGQSRTPAH